MRPRRKIWHTLLACLLLLQLPLGNGVFADTPPMSHPSAMAMDGSMGHPCHATASSAVDCEDMGCVFCGLANLGEHAPINTYLAYLLFLMDDAAPATPRFEQPVELRPPKHSGYA